jgi:hypothetical protein
METKSFDLCEISIRESPESLKFNTACDAFSNTSLGRILGPALKLCIFIQGVFWQKLSKQRSYINSKVETLCDFFIMIK